MIGAGFAVQLEHDAKEMTWENHGYVTVVDEKGEILAHADDLQHNRKYGERATRAKAMFDQINGAYGKSSAAASISTA